MKKILKALFSLLVVLGLVSVSVACNKKTEEKEETKPAPQETPQLTEIELTSKLVADESGVYTVAAAEGKATITATKNDAAHEWANVNVPLENVAGMNSLRFSFKGTCVILLKLESSAGAKEVKLLLGDAAVAHEWDLSGAEEQAILAGENVKVVLFLMPGSKTGTGTATVENFVISPEQAMYGPINSGYTNIVAGSNNYDGSSETFHFNNYWAPRDPDTYEFEYKEDGSVVVNFKKSDTYNYAGTIVAGAFSKFPFVTLVVTGTKGQAMLLKADQLGIELKVDFTGEKQIVTLDLSSKTEKDRAALKDMLIFAAPGDAEATGSFTVHDVYFTTEFEGTLPDAQKLVYNGTDKGFNVNSDWYSGDEGVYEIKSSASPWNVTYNKAAKQNWAALKVDIEGQFSNFETFSFGLEVAKDVKYIVKIAGSAEGAALEYKGVGTGECAGNKIDLTQLTIAQRNSLNQVLIFIDYENEEANSGSYKIHWAGLEGFKYAGVGAVEYTGGYAKPNLTGDAALWHDSGDKVYTVQKASDAGKEGAVYVTYKKTAHAYASMRIYLLGGKLGDFKTLAMGLKAAEGTELLIKVEGTGAASEKIEYKYVGTGVYKDFAFDLTKLTTEERNKINSILIMAAPGVDAAEGDFEIHWGEFRDENRAVLIYDGADTTSFDVNREWYSGDAGVFNLANNASPWEFKYTRAAKQNWSALKVNIKGDFAGFTKLTFGVEVAKDVKYIVKIAGEGWDAEYKGVGIGACDGHEISLTDKTAEQLATVKEVLIFVDYENEEAHEGTLKIHWAGINK